MLLYGQFPPIDKMDASISTLVACEYGGNVQAIEFSFSTMIVLENYPYRRI